MYQTIGLIILGCGFVFIALGVVGLVNMFELLETSPNCNAYCHEFLDHKNSFHAL